MSLNAKLLLPLFALLLLAIAPARADVANAPGANLEVSLVTYSPGATYWERFGHDALQLRDIASGESINFNYGVFDFNEANFFLNFARGHMHYLMDAEPSAPEEAFYVQEGRSIARQRLDLTPEQAAALRDFLFWNLRPENAGYDYDYYVDNCTTRVRDALDKALGGAIHAALANRPGGMTYRQQTDRLMSAQPWLMLVLDLGLGPYADQPLDAWHESFLPAELQASLRGIRVDDGRGGTRPLVLDERELSPSRLDAPPTRAPDLRLPLAIAGLLLATVLLAAGRRLRVGFALLGSLYLVAAGLVGLLLLALWTLTTHHSAWANANLLLFNPLAFALLPALWRRRARPGRVADTLLALQLLALLAAVLLHLLPGTVQQNQPWILFAMPVWLALAWTLRQPVT
ncbi:DUF4105 domain-containing protein [Fulvimonas sp. R45]|uniref:lipoprotein N-acyltransferase Lnb domain-containing protein n=1 Tax=Fulvimonas sp. R45 TaxID=3045937 RepID=UPI00265DC33A|nr:DUF4105 domain-containing protein [Fulvimonas sp. R45]MDO1530196.1 DUF4105 domain-containing protein [Fulvimonas sp. R45]